MFLNDVVVVRPRHDSVRVDDEGDVSVDSLLLFHRLHDLGLNQFLHCRVPHGIRHGSRDGRESCLPIPVVFNCQEHPLC